MASSQDRGQATLFLSEQRGQTVPFSDVRGNEICNHTAGGRIVGLDKNHEDVMENLDTLSEEQLDELLREAHNINQRLKSLERK